MTVRVAASQSVVLLLGSAMLLVAAARATAAVSLRPPSVPLVAHDPYFSIWSPADRLADASTTHWTGKPHPLRSLVRIDGKPFRLMGTEPADVPPLLQVALDVLPTRTIYTFAGAQVRLTLSFITPALPDDLDALSRPLTYIEWEAAAQDGGTHEVRVYFDAGAELAVNTPDQPVSWGRAEAAGLHAVRLGSQAQPVLERQGDDVRIDWGYAYLAAKQDGGTRAAIADGAAARRAFAAGGSLPDKDVPAARDVPARSAPVLALCLDLGKVGREPVRRWIMLAYDDEYSIRYFEERLRGYWRRGGMDAAGLLQKAAAEFPQLADRCRKLDADLMADLAQVGGERYARIAALAYRQTLAGSKLVADSRGKPLFFPKENHSNGCIGTVDVIYPMSPFCLLLAPALAKAVLVPVLDYAASPRWKFPFAPHDLGRYPYATGQVYGGGERTEDRQMMVEESANMILMAAALARAEGSASFAESYWPLLTKWAEYLKEKGYDPENQLCTDDFAGHLAHNVNLSAKAIVALGACAQLAEKLGKAADARAYGKLAREFAARWVKEADDGDHFRLAFDLPGTWSQKYNLAWDRVLGLGLFPAGALRKEMDFYKRTQQRYGLPLDGRQAYTKLDWVLWTAAMTGDRADFEALSAPVLDFLNETPDRSPMTDWYFTDTAKKRGFTARPVVGGVFMAMLGDAAMWQKWARRGANVSGPWAPVPIRAVAVIVPTGENEAAAWRVRFEAPKAEDWMKPGFAAAGWDEKPAPFGFGPAQAGSPIRTPWESREVWLRREFELKDVNFANLRLRISHSGDCEVWMNGILAAQWPGGTRSYEHFEIRPEALKGLRPGRNVMAIHAQATGAGPRRRDQVDAGIVDLRP